MQLAQFQIESTGTSQSPTNYLHRRTRAHSDEATRTGLETLLLGLQLRGWLSDWDREFLDCLSFDNSITFLVHGNTYLHPDGVTLFPLEILQSGPEVGGDAFFTQRHRSVDVEGVRAKAIQSARIGEIKGEPLILGMVGVDSTAHRAQHESRFADLILMCRRAMQTTQTPVASIQARLSKSHPAVVLNRCSGRILAVNKRAEKLLECDAASIVDREYSEFKSRLEPYMAGRSLRLENISNEGSHLTVVSLVSTPAKVPLPDDPARGMLRSMQNRATCIEASARNLQNIMVRVPGETTSELLRIVAEEAEELRAQVKRLDLLLAPGAVQSIQTDPPVELRKAVTAVSARRQTGRIQTFVSEVDTAQLPENALFYLCEAILDAHLANRCQQADTEIRLRRPLGDNGLEISVRTGGLCSASVSQINRDRLAYAVSLAERLGGMITSNADRSENMIETHVTIPT